jgi:hypothetical protein
MWFHLHFEFISPSCSKNEHKIKTPPSKIEESFKHTKKNHESFNPFDMRVIERAGDQ